MKRKLLFIFSLFALLGSSVICHAEATIAVSRVSDCVYTGAPITPTPTLRDGAKTLRKDVDYTIEYRNNINVGKATVVITGIGNYMGDFSRDFNITKARVVVAVEANQGKIYGQPDPKLTYKVASGELKGKDIVTGDLVRDAGEESGIYAITQGTLSAGDNYELVVIKNSFNIGKASITIKPNLNQTKVYGQPDPEFQYTIAEGALVGSDAVTGQLNRIAGENVGTYAITLGSLSAGTNYDLRFSPGSFEITKASIAVKPDAGLSKVYGDPDPVLTYTVVTGALGNGDTFRGSLTRQPGEDIGQYTVQRGSLMVNDNYDIKIDETQKFEIKRKSFQ